MENPVISTKSQNFLDLKISQQNEKSQKKHNPIGSRCLVLVDGLRSKHPCNLSIQHIFHMKMLQPKTIKYYSKSDIKKIDFF